MVLLHVNDEGIGSLFGSLPYILVSCQREGGHTLLVVHVVVIVMILLVRGVGSHFK